MSSIESVIARARRPGAFSERQRFTLARSRAIQKMRHFALADPHYYVLELIQSAIASGAVYIDVRADEATITLSYLGGGVPEGGLANLFDFLFASKERGELSGLRALALGVNALMLFAPTRIVIESGDGTAAGSARLEICGDQDRYDVGRPEQPLTGTYVRAEGLRRAKVAKELKLHLLGGGADERSIIEQRCLTAPVPILFNQEPIFGHATVRIPPAFGYRRSLAVDEGDLFGCLGLDPLGGKPLFRLLTYGVMVEAIEHEILPGAAIGGVINFDALHKTADHAKVVRDERLEELWVRLRPYAQQLRRGGSAAEAAYDVRIHGGGVIPASQLRPFLRELGRVVVIDPETPREEVPTAKRIAAAMDAELLVAPGSQVAALRLLGGREVTILTPSLASAEDVAFYTGALAEAPARPWLVAPIEAPTLAAVELREALGRALGALDAGDSALALGDRGEVRVTVYSPAGRGGAGEVTVRLWSLGREVSSHVVATASSGGAVVIAEIPELSPARLRARRGEASVGERVAEVIAGHVAPQLAEASRRALLALVGQEIRPGTPQARLALAELVRTTIVRFRRDGAAISARLSPLRTLPGLDLLGVPILATLDGRALAARDLAALLDAGHGVLYGVVPEVAADLEGLERGRILDLDRESEALLVALVGEGAYVRVDGRDRLAEHGGFVIRDLAWGLRDFPEGPLLIEGDDPGALSAASRAALEEELFAQVLQRYVEAPADAADAAAEELRRQALRHVQRYLCAALARGDAEPLGVDLVVALGPDRRGYSLRQIRAAMREGGPLLLHYDHGALPPPIDGIVRGEGPPTEVLASPYLARLLAGVGPVALAFDVTLPGEVVDVPKDMGSIDGLLVAEQVAEGEIDGVLGIPRAGGAAPRIVLLDRDHRVVHVLAESARDTGMSGVLRVRATSWDESVLDGVAALLARVGDRLLERLGGAIGGLEGEARRRAMAILLDHAGRHLVLVADASGRVVPELTSARAGAILDLPLFPGAGGLPVRGAWVIQRCCEAWASGRAARGRDFVAGDAEAELVAWLDVHVDAGRVARPPSRPVVHASAPEVMAPPEAATRPLSRLTLAATLERHLNALRPDPPVVGEAWRPRALVRVDDEAAVTGPLARVKVLGGTRLSIELNPWHWLAEWAREVGHREPEALAWALLAVYAEALRVLDDGAAEHEEAMQRRVAEALERGSLRPVYGGAG